MANEWDLSRYIVHRYALWRGDTILSSYPILGALTNIAA